MVRPRTTEAARVSAWVMRRHGRWAISSKRKLKKTLEPGQDIRNFIGYSLGGPESAEGRAMAKLTGRKTYYEDDGRYVIRGAELLKRLKKGAFALEFFSVGA